MKENEGEENEKENDRMTEEIRRRRKEVGCEREGCTYTFFQEKKEKKRRRRRRRRIMKRRKNRLM